MAHLYELTGQYLCLTKEAEDDIFGVLEIELGQIKDKIEDKAENIAKYILSLDAEADTLSSEMQRLSARRESIYKKVAWLKGYLLQELQAVGLDRVKRELVTIFLKTNPPSVNVVDPDQIPTKYWRVIPESHEVDKRLIIDQFKNTGEIIPGTEIIRDKKSLQIR